MKRQFGKEGVKWLVDASVHLFDPAGAKAFIDKRLLLLLECLSIEVGATQRDDDLHSLPERRGLRVILVGMIEKPLRPSIKQGAIRCVQNGSGGDKRGGYPIADFHPERTKRNWPLRHARPQFLLAAEYQQTGMVSEKRRALGCR